MGENGRGEDWSRGVTGAACQEWVLGEGTRRVSGMGLGDLTRFCYELAPISFFLLYFLSRDSSCDHLCDYCPSDLLSL